jgi:hypothetical protein
MKISSVLAIAVLAVAAQQSGAAVSCASLKSVKIAGASITLAEDVTPNPEWKLPPSVFTGPTAPPGPRSTKVPFCRVALTIGKENRVEVWLPRNWNGAFQGVGNGGLSGGLNYPSMASALAGGFAAASTDTGHHAFKARGGKVILYHGWADQLLSPYNTIDYYQSVQQKMGPAQQDFMALFMAPGMWHCAGGPGPDQFDAVGAVMKWVEQGEAPTRLIASHVTAGKVDRTRPLCAWPNVAKYKGTGSTDEAASFTCVAPKST